MGCPGAKLAQGSNYHSHGPSVKSSESYPSDVGTGKTVFKKIIPDMSTLHTESPP